MNGIYFIEGERLYLRGVTADDVNETYLRWMHDPEVMQYLESRFQPHSLSSLHEFVTQMQHDRDQLFLAIVLKDKDRHIGNIKLGPINWIHRFADIGLLIGEKDCWGKGYATEAIQLLTQYAFNALNLHHLTAGCYATNMGSARAFLKAGWVEEGRRKSYFYSAGKYVDEILLGIVSPLPENYNTPSDSH